jgi:hypothetical protein
VIEMKMLQGEASSINRSQAPSDHQKWQKTLAGAQGVVQLTLGQMRACVKRNRVDFRPP